MITIYHNPRCSKSREGLSIVENSGREFCVVNYVNTPLTEDELSEIISKLGIAPIELVRKSESVWKENYKDKKISDSEIIAAMVKHPNLIERPIVVSGNKAVVGRPPEKIKDIL